MARTAGPAGGGLSGRRGPRGLLRRLEQLGGCCDCEALMNVFPDYPETIAPLPCAGQPQPGSAMPCDLRALPRSA